MDTLIGLAAILVAITATVFLALSARKVWAETNHLNQKGEQ